VSEPVVAKFPASLVPPCVSFIDTPRQVLETCFGDLTTTERNNMFGEFEDEELPSFDSLSPVEKQEFYDYITKQMHLIMNKAENSGVLFDLITKWPRDKQVAYEMAAVIENRVLEDDED
jgi:hypothetical protein